MAQTNSRAVRAIFGLNGSGKTITARRMVEEVGRAMIVDGGFAEDDFPGIRMGSFWEFHDYMKRNADGLFRVRFCPTRAEFPYVCRWAKEAGDCLLVVDEADRYLRLGDLDPEFMDLVMRGRHYGANAGVSLVIVAQNPMQVPIDVRRCSTSIIAFNNAEPADVEWLGKMMGRDMEPVFPMLKPGQYVEWVKAEGAHLGYLPGFEGSIGVAHHLKVGLKVIGA